MRVNTELAQKTGLLSGMRIYKFFKTIYSHCQDKKHKKKEKISKPNSHSYTFINNDYGCAKQFARDLAPYFSAESKPKKNTPSLVSRSKS
jgi:hypothetical protein